MLGYVTLGTNDLPRAAAFYDALLAEIGGTRMMDFGRGYAWGTSRKRPMLGVMTPYDGKAATAGRHWNSAARMKVRRARVETVSMPDTFVISTATSSTSTASAERYSAISS
jgi:catechol 2,3-dioxygenase-like lactoylglutathione lyase family enzyme